MVLFREFLERMKEELELGGVRGSREEPLFIVEFLQEGTRRTPRVFYSPLAVTCFAKDRGIDCLMFHYLNQEGAIPGGGPSTFRYENSWRVLEITSRERFLRNLVIRIARAY